MYINRTGEFDFYKYLCGPRGKLILLPAKIGGKVVTLDEEVDASNWNIGSLLFALRVLFGSANIIAFGCCCLALFIALLKSSCLVMAKFGLHTLFATCCCFVFDV